MIQSLITDPSTLVEADIKSKFPSFLKRTQYCKFWFRRERDANLFCRENKPKTTPGVDFITRAFVVQL